MPKKACNQTIECDVESCRFNDNCQYCGLDCIKVAACSNCHSGDPEKESMCASYKQR